MDVQPPRDLQKIKINSNNNENLGKRMRNAIATRNALAEKKKQKALYNSVEALLNRSLAATGRRTFAQSVNNRTKPPVAPKKSFIRPQVRGLALKMPVNSSKQLGQHLAPFAPGAPGATPGATGAPGATTGAPGATTGVTGAPGATTGATGATTGATTGAPGATTGVTAPAKIEVLANNIEKVEKYKKMFKMGIPIESIEHKMKSDGINPEKIPLYSSLITGIPIAVKTENPVKVNQPVANKHAYSLQNYKNMKSNLNRKSLILALKRNRYNPANVFEDFSNTEYNAIMAEVDEEKKAKALKNAEEKEKKRLANSEILKQITPENVVFFKGLSEADKKLFLKIQQLNATMRARLWTNNNTRKKFFNKPPMEKMLSINPTFIAKKNQAKVTVDFTEKEREAVTKIETLEKDIKLLKAAIENIKYKKVNGKMVEKVPLPQHDFDILVKSKKELAKKEAEVDKLKTPELLAKIAAVRRGNLVPNVKPAVTAKAANASVRNNTKATAKAALTALFATRQAPTTRKNNAAAKAATNVTKNNNAAKAAAKAEKNAKKAKLEALFAARAKGE